MNVLQATMLLSEFEEFKATGDWSGKSSSRWVCYLAHVARLVSFLYVRACSYLGDEGLNECRYSQRSLTLNECACRQHSLNEAFFEMQRRHYDSTGQLWAPLQRSAVVPRHAHRAMTHCPLPAHSLTTTHWQRTHCLCSGAAAAFHDPAAGRAVPRRHWLTLRQTEPTAGHLHGASE